MSIFGASKYVCDMKRPPRSIFPSSFLPFLLFALLLYVACGGDGGSTAGTPSPAPSTTEPPASGELVKLVLHTSDEMKYDRKELKVRAGTRVELTLHHTGSMAKAIMGHNVVILKPGTDINAFGQRAMAAVDTEYIPAGDEIIAHTKLIGGGESTSITFNAPPVGSYDFICSFPGHYGLMRGQFIVE